LEEVERKADKRHDEMLQEIRQVICMLYAVVLQRLSRVEGRAEEAAPVRAVPGDPGDNQLTQESFSDFLKAKIAASGKSVKEISEQTGVTRPAVYTRIHKAALEYPPLPVEHTRDAIMGIEATC
jgi:hypothetical protein